MNKKFKLLTLFGFLCSGFAFGQLGENKEVFTRQDTLRGSLNADRTWWDVTYYNILVTPDYEKKTITGKVDISFKVLSIGKRMQIDLQEPLVLTKAFLGDTKINYTRDGNIYILDIPANILKKGTVQKLALRYEGSPKVAKRAPWDGG
jgi:hypothetical protein